MNKYNYCGYANVFQGNGEINLPNPEGIAATWFFIKAQCGNTYPHAALPFGKMTCGAYSGGYPTGYGNHRPNCCGGVGKFSSDNLIKGFSHLHQSGTGAIGIYYNYAIVTPFYGELKNAEKVHLIHNEDAKPGYYKVLFNEITAETTVSEQVAYHRYTFNKDGGKISVDFSNDGLNKIFGESFYSHAESALLKITASDEICAKVVLKNVPLFFCVKCEGGDVQSKLWENYSYLSGTDLSILDTSRPFGGEFTFDKGNAVIKVSISTQGFDEARAYIRNSADCFDDAADKAYQIWNQMLSRIDIKTDDEELKTIFYSNLYHSMLKPSNWNGESVLGVNGDVYVDFATLWDQYKTQLPLIFTLFGDVSNQIVRALLNIGDSIGFLPVNFTLGGNLHTEQQQACMLAEHVFADAYYRDLKEAHNKKLLEVVKKDLNNERYQQYQSTGFCKYYTHILDMAEGCFAIADLAVKIGDLEFAERLYDLSRHWVNAFDKKTGLLSDRSWYYEGNKWNYSFRLLRNMQHRIELAGGKEKFVELLDSFMVMIKSLLFK